MFLPKSYGNAEKLLKNLKEKPEKYWIKKGELRVLKLFHLMAARVPAYKDFLRKNRINPEKIKTLDDFRLIPFIDKNNYLRKYPLQMLCWDGKFESERWTISTTSGTTGNPFYFPRTAAQDRQYAITAELYLRTNFQIHRKTTLYIDGFAMGAWIGGLFTYQAVKLLSESGDYQISLITPGIFKHEIISAVKNLGDKFDQIIIGGYPPFIKDTIDDGINQGLNWKKYNLKFIFSAEGFSENFRDYIIEKTGLTDVYKDTLNHYGTVDLGTMAHETPLSILIRRIIVENKLYKTFFSEDHKLPTLVQYNPELFYFEEIDRQLICSAFSGLPLIRYDLKDKGGIISGGRISELFAGQKLDLKKEIIKAGITDTVWNLPFVYVHERTDLIVKLYGANIYPETVKKSLNTEELADLITGKFLMTIKFDKNQNQLLEINVELKKSVKKSDKLRLKVQAAVIERLLKENSEYRSNYSQLPDRQIPKILLWTYEHRRHFTPGVKQKWTAK